MTNFRGIRTYLFQKLSKPPSKVQPKSSQKRKINIQCKTKYKISQRVLYCHARTLRLLRRGKNVGLFCLLVLIHWDTRNRGNKSREEGRNWGRGHWRGGWGLSWRGGIGSCGRWGAKWMCSMTLDKEGSWCWLSNSLRKRNKKRSLCFCMRPISKIFKCIEKWRKDNIKRNLNWVKNCNKNH